jgi:hypothetical protein
VITRPVLVETECEKGAGRDDLEDAEHNKIYYEETGGLEKTSIEELNKIIRKKIRGDIRPYRYVKREDKTEYFKLRAG